MNYPHLFKNPIVKGTFILTLAGILTRCIGFYYRIFLSNLIGARELGIYQLIFPVYVLAISLCCQGMQAALTKTISMLCASGTRQQMKLSFRFTLCTCLLLSLFTCVAIFIYAEPIGIYFIHNQETISCIRVIAFGLPFVAIKCCIHGYCLGLKSSKILAMSQFIEQLSRVLGTYIAASALLSGNQPTAIIAAYGIVIGEAVSCIYSCISIGRHFKEISTCCKDRRKLSKKELLHKNKNILSMLFKDGLLLTGNRVSMTLLSSLEAVLIPSMLVFFYGDSDYCLELFGVLTGMAMPFIMLPSTITNSLSSMLLPAVSESKAQQGDKNLAIMTQSSLHFCVIIGIFSTVLFIIFGKDLGITVFGNEMAGEFIFMMAFLCPFIYISATLSSILNGLDKTGLNLFYHLLSITIRICFILFVVPAVGIRGYMWGLLASYLVLTMLLLTTISTEVKFSFDCNSSILIPAILATISGALLYLAYTYIIKITSLPRLMILTFILCIYGLFYFSMTLVKDYIFHK